ncbi:MAG: carboxypeptidase regulatory-like domain-containing protein [Candidatus Velthaea sp.]
MKTAHRIFALLAAAIFSLVFIVPAAPAMAQSSQDTGIIAITVLDAATKRALQDARIMLFGATQASALTNKSGVVKYTDVPSGLYRVRVVKAGFQGSTSSQFEVLGNKEVEVEVNMGPQVARAPSSSATPAPTDSSGLTVIGRVTARVSINTRDVDQDSTVRKVSDSLTDALSKIAGVDVTQSSNDPDAAQTISLNGHDESQTAVTLDGIPLGAPGAAVNLRGINTDLFAGAGVSFAAQAGALGGAVNFRTLQPTQTWVSRFQSSYGTFDRFNYSLAETGSAGKLGVAVMHTLREGNNPLTFNTFTDQSGLTYAHGGESSNAGNFMKLRYSLGDRTTLNFSALQNDSGTSALCTQDVTLLPCGIGPGNTNAGKFQFMYGTAQTLIGDTTVSLTSYVNSNNSFQNDALRTVNGVLNPLVSNTQSVSRGVAFLATINQGKSTWTLNGSTINSLTNFNPIVNSSAFLTPSTFSNTSVTFQLSDQYKVNDRLTIGPNMSYARTNGTGGTVLAGLSGQWRPTGIDNFGASVSAGSSQAANGLIRTFSDPASARFNCAAGTANVNGPGDQPGPQSAISYDVNWTHQWRLGQFRFDAYRQTQADQLINAQIVATSLGMDASNPYIAALQGFYASPFTCGAGAVLNPNSVYVSEPIGDTTRTYQGFTLSGRIALGPHWVMLPSYQTNVAAVTAAGARLAGVNSTTIIGAQIPGRPLHRGNLTFDGEVPKLGLELLANVQYVGSNNAQHLSPYGLVNVGASHALGAGRISFLASNIFNTESGALSSLAFAEPIATSGGNQLFVAANPNAPRQFSVTFTVNTGARSGAGGARPSRSAAAANAAGAAAALAGQGTAQQRARGLVAVTPYPPPAGTDPLSVADKRDSCKPEDAQVAAPVLASLRAAVDAYKAGKPLPPVEGIALVPHGAPTSDNWYFEIRPNLPQRPGQNGQQGPGGGGRGGGFGGEGGGPPPVGPGPQHIVVQPNPNASPGPRGTPNPEFRAAFEKFRATISCTYFSALTQDDVKAKGFTEFTGRNALGYAPGIGLFAVRAPELGSGGGSLKKPQ